MNVKTFLSFYFHRYLFRIRSILEIIPYMIRMHKSNGKNFKIRHFLTIEMMMPNDLFNNMKQEHHEYVTNDGVEGITVVYYIKPVDNYKHYA